ncbi:hypothetical protein CAPTEDRAFT_195247 [Capitella teleta]|uniref:Uncharacterized protein n=1 Tax=Capitella teleta TaxID=283909 RepID=R7TXY5_CAPTE|nr:hypothetical protein CAPTEDRAFT_195247 [Capitella teleta]|eukprot:ELT95800.1 hypothetical protein CAPTEDRAFT_195247 [Capitella teleta]
MTSHQLVPRRSNESVKRTHYRSLGYVKVVKKVQRAELAMNRCPVEINRFMDSFSKKALIWRVRKRIWKVAGVSAVGRPLLVGNQGGGGGGELAHFEHSDTCNMQHTKIPEMLIRGDTRHLRQTEKNREKLPQTEQCKRQIVDF